MTAASEPIGTTIIGLEEQMRGWLAAIAKERQPRRQVAAYRELYRLFEFFSHLHIALFDDRAVAKYDELRSSGVRIGTMDLKMASIALVNSAKLLTANKRDFEKVPGLEFENWLD
jgi:tRNA(fMet)-specific endonuclease VapC